MGFFLTFSSHSTELQWSSAGSWWHQIHCVTYHHRWSHRWHAANNQSYHQGETLCCFRHSKLSKYQKQQANRELNCTFRFLSKNIFLKRCFVPKILQGSRLPLSIIIVGVGDENFKGLGSSFFVGPCSHRTCKQICTQIYVQTLWCCLQAVWTLPLTTMCSIICICLLQGAPHPVWTGPRDLIPASLNPKTINLSQNDYYFPFLFIVFIYLAMEKLDSDNDVLSFGRLKADRDIVQVCYLSFVNKTHCYKVWKALVQVLNKNTRTFCSIELTPSTLLFFCFFRSLLPLEILTGTTQRDRPQRRSNSGTRCSGKCLSRLKVSWTKIDYFPRSWQREVFAFDSTWDSRLPCALWDGRTHHICSWRFLDDRIKTGNGNDLAVVWPLTRKFLSTSNKTMLTQPARRIRRNSRKTRSAEGQTIHILLTQTFCHSSGCLFCKAQSIQNFQDKFYVFPFSGHWIRQGLFTLVWAFMAALCVLCQKQETLWLTVLNVPRQIMEQSFAISSPP